MVAQDLRFIELKSASFLLEEDGYVRIRPRDDYMVDLEEAIKQGYAIMKLCNGSKRPFLVDNRGVFPLYTPEARDYLINSLELKKYRAAEAILLNQLPSLANGAVRRKHSFCPNSYFLYEREAIEWLGGFKNSKISN